MAMWDRIKDQAKGLQQQAQGARGTGGQSGQSGHAGHGAPGGYGQPGAGSTRPGGSSRSGGGSKAQLVSALKSQLTSLKTELKSGAYRDASMAMCALVAAADGNVDPAERQHVESLILNNDVLQNFPADQLRQRFNKHVDQLSFNFQQGKAEALQEIAKAAKKPTEARAVVQTGFVVAGADGFIAQAEEQVLREACSTLGLSPQEFGL
ncbi:tellurite resistance TerB family protein [Streptomyces adelaidensis]|uniref:tellurite resistance TerB family protein n=1 Tax=Streptomyces adelaidensis TaxID=2796465 RepID=UPI001904AFC3|nr:TerB family tellurite resistance protein [Streptomyces adelaidensis]